MVQADYAHYAECAEYAEQFTADRAYLCPVGSLWLFLDFNILRQRVYKKKLNQTIRWVIIFIEPVSIIVKGQAYYVDGDSHEYIAIIADVDLDLYAEVDVDDNFQVREDLLYYLRWVPPVRAKNLDHLYTGIYAL